VPRTGADIANTPVENGDFHPIEDFAGVDIDELPASDDEIRVDLSHGAADQSFHLYLCAAHGTLTNMVHFSLPKEGVEFGDLKRYARLVIEYDKQMTI
jgi:hypothetical protein